MTGVWPDPDPGWRVRMGVGLVEHAPLSDERKTLVAKEAERERKADELAAEQRREAAYERRWELERRGTVAHSVGDVLAASAVAADRQDRRDAKRDEDAAVLLGKPKRNPDHTLYALTAAAAARREVEATEPATLVDVRREVEKETSGLKVALWKLKHGKG